MPKFISCVLAALAATAASPAAAQSMPLNSFLTKADALKKKGPLALFSGDMKLLKKEITQSAAALRSERIALVKAGKSPDYCPPEKSSR